MMHSSDQEQKTLYMTGDFSGRAERARARCKCLKFLMQYRMEKPLPPLPLETAMTTHRIKMDRIALTFALRDFFYARDIETLRESVRAIPHADDLDEAALTALEHEFNTLFVGPNAPVAPPYASVYLEKEPRLMGEATLAVRRLYGALGVAPAHPGMPDDFLPYEFEAWLVLADMTDNETDAEAAAALAWLTGHLRAWLPAFIRRMRHAPLSSCMEKVANALCLWLELAQEAAV